MKYKINKHLNCTQRPKFIVKKLLLIIKVKTYYVKEMKHVPFCALMLIHVIMPPYIAQQIIHVMLNVMEEIHVNTLRLIGHYHQFHIVWNVMEENHVMQHL